MQIQITDLHFLNKKGVKSWSILDFILHQIIGVNDQITRVLSPHLHWHLSWEGITLPGASILWKRPIIWKLNKTGLIFFLPMLDVSKTFDIQMISHLSLDPTDFFIMTLRSWPLLPNRSFLNSHTTFSYFQTSGLLAGFPSHAISIRMLLLTYFMTFKNQKPNLNFLFLYFSAQRAV